MNFKFEINILKKKSFENISHKLIHQHYEIKYSLLIIIAEDDLNFFILNEICHMFVQVLNLVLMQSQSLKIVKNAVHN